MTSQLPAKKRALIERLLQSSEESLERQIGAQLPSELKHHPPGNEEKETRVWFQRYAPELQDLVCQSQSVKRLLENDSAWEPLTVVAAIMDGIGSVVFHGIPVTLLSVYVFKRGIKELCAKC